MFKTRDLNINNIFGLRALLIERKTIPSNKVFYLTLKELEADQGYCFQTNNTPWSECLHDKYDWLTASDHDSFEPKLSCCETEYHPGPIDTKM